jgi:ubiquinone/menaquinone biosynthesis C-methylase UbiE
MSPIDSASSPARTSYETVTEQPGVGANTEQLDALHTRYRLAGDLGEGKDVLEVGCGSGIGLGYLARRAKSLSAGDYDERLLGIARKQGVGVRVLRQIDAHDLPFDDASFDVVLLLEAIYYLRDPRAFLASARRVLRPGGVVFICSANRERPDFNPSPFSVRYYSAAELSDMLAKSGFVPRISAGFPIRRDGLRASVLHFARSMAIKLNLIPKTMAAKAILKRLAFGRLVPLPERFDESVGRFQPPVPVSSAEPVRNHKVLYAVGTVRDDRART